MIRYYVYDIYLLQLGFHPVAVVGKLVQQKKRLPIYKKRNNTQNNTVILNTLNRKQNKNTNIQKILKT